MAGKLFEWLDHRTGIRSFIGMMLIEHIPGGAKWRYVWGSTLAFVFSIQLITGVCLMTAYSPSDTTAWGSVHYIQYQMDWGWLIRGLHHFGSQTMMVLIGLHMLQVVIAGAQLPPREINWWTGLVLLGITFGLSLTGYLLPWDQKGYWATRVATNIAGSIPGIGTYLQRVIIGGSDYGNHTLTRFYALHVFVLPGSLIAVLILHIALFRRHGVTHSAQPKGEGWFWPDQAFRDLIVCLVIFGIMLALVFKGHGHPVEAPADSGTPAAAAENAPHSEKSTYQRWAKAGQEGRGANLDAPADRNTANYPARPEWYFLFLFQLLKYFEGEQTIVGTVYIPNGVMVLLALLPLFGYGRMRPFGRFLGFVVVLGLLVAVGALTFLALADDSPSPLFGVGPSGGEKAVEFQKNVEVAEQKAKRAVQLAMAGIPDRGAVHLLRNDPMTAGADLFKTKCASCHSFTPNADEILTGFTEGKFTAGDLGSFGKASWIRGLLNNPADPAYFGRTSLQGMIKWRKGVEKDRLKMSAEDKAKQDGEFETIATWLADQAKPMNKRDVALEKKATPLFEENCSSCHKVGNIGENDAPELTNYGSEDWLRTMIVSPAHKTRYGGRNQMPAFRNLSGPGADFAKQEFRDANPDFKGDIIELSDVQRELIIRFVQRDGRIVFGGGEISGAKKND